jgi:hypothetical protein
MAVRNVANEIKLPRKRIVWVLEQHAHTKPLVYSATTALIHSRDWDVESASH